MRTSWRRGLRSRQGAPWTTAPPTTRPMLGTPLSLGLTMSAKSTLEHTLMVAICHMLAAELELNGKFGLMDRGEFVHTKKKTIFIVDKKLREDLGLLNLFRNLFCENVYCGATVLHLIIFVKYLLKKNWLFFRKFSVLYESQFLIKERFVYFILYFKDCLFFFRKDYRLCIHLIFQP